MTDSELDDAIDIIRWTQMNSDVMRQTIADILELLSANKMNPITAAQIFASAEGQTIFDNRFTLKTTDQLAEGSTNKYYTDAKVLALIPAIPKIKTYPVIVAGGAGNAVVSYTGDFTTVTGILPIVNDSSVNYTYQWSVNTGAKTVTVNTKVSTGLTVLTLQVLGVPVNVANGTVVYITLIGT